MQEEEIVAIRIPREDVVAWAKLYKEIGCSHNEITTYLILLCDRFALNHLSHTIEEGMRIARARFFQDFNREITPEEEKEIRLAILNQIREQIAGLKPEDVAAVVF